MLCQFCQSDPRGTQIVHYCQGRCGSREEALDNVTAAVSAAGLIKGFSSVTPSKGRHGSTTESLGEQSAGVMCYSILPRTMRRAFPSWQSMDLPADEEDNGDGAERRKHMQRKTYRAVQQLSCKRNNMLSSMLSWAVDHCDYLWMRLQYLDARHSTLVDSVGDKRNPSRQCMTEHCRLLLVPLGEGQMQTVFQHWGG